MNFKQELIAEKPCYQTLTQYNRPSGRVYVDDDENEYPSITSVLSILSEEGIKKWRAKVGEEEANRISSTASFRGTKVHDLLENYVLNEEVSKKDLGAYATFKGIQPIIDKSLSKVYATERRMFSKHLGVAGTMDCVGVWDNKISIIDWKTSRKWKKKEWISSYFMQATAYAIMWEERTGTPISQLVVCIAGDLGPQVFVEHRDNWTKPLIETIKEYNRRKIFGRK